MGARSSVSSIPSVASTPSTRPLADQLRDAAHRWGRGQYDLIRLSASFADSAEWVLDGAPTAAHWLATVADIETCTAREWIRIGRKLNDLPQISHAYERGEISYSKVRTLSRFATPENETELLDIARQAPASDLGRAIAYWFKQNNSPEDLEAHQHQQRSIKWRTEPDGMVLFSLRLPPILAATFIALLTTIVMRSKPRRHHPADAWPTLAQQHADAFEQLLTDGPGTVDTEVVIHTRGDGCTLDDGTPVNDHAVANLVPMAFIRALIHDIDGRPIDATNRRRHPTTRQKRVVAERDGGCVDCGRRELLQFDHCPPHEQTGHTVTSELKQRCAPCHQQRHAGEND